MRSFTITKKPFNRYPEKKNVPRTNEEISATKVRVISGDGANLGVMSPDAARDVAYGRGLDLVEVSPHAEPPVCKVMDFGKYKYSKQKKESLAKKKQKTIDTKEVKFRPGTGDHDYQVKLRNVLRFLEDGDQVKVTLRFRGREMAHQDLGRDILNRVRDDVGETGRLVSTPKLEGRQIIMVIGPNK